MNRKRRKKVGTEQQDWSVNLEVVHPNAAGIDIGNESHYVAVPPGRDPDPVRQFSCFTEDLHRLAGWLKSCGIDTVAMQSTGVYWLPVYEILTEEGLQVFLVNARHTKNLPGRKTDVQECQWLLQLHTFGLLNNSFRPPEEICVLRAYWRQRAEHVSSASACIQRMQKVLTEMNVQLANVISDISGLTGLAIIQAILDGERDRYKLADLAHARIRATREEIARSLEGNWRKELVFILQQERNLYLIYQQQIAECDTALATHLQSLDNKSKRGFHALPGVLLRQANDAETGAVTRRRSQVGFARCSVCDRQSFARTTPSNRTTNRGSGENRCKREGRSSPGHFLSSGLLREYCEKPAFLAY